MTQIHVTEWDDTEAGQGAVRPPAVLVHGIFTWGTDPAYGFGALRHLARERRLLLVDRRGYGDSPDLPEGARSDWATDAEDLVQLLRQLPDGAHLVGHANGGLAALLAAAAEPQLLRSLTLIQPSVFWTDTEHPAVAAMLERTAGASVPPGTSPEEYLRASTEGIGMPMPEPTPRRLRAVTSSMGERPVWEAHGELAPVTRSTWPKLVVTGDWEGAPPLYRRYAGEALMAASEAVARETGAALLRVPGHYPHTQQPEAVARALREIWATGDASN